MSNLLARIAVIAPEGLIILVQFAVDVCAHRMEAQIKVGSIQSWISTSDNVQRNTITMLHSDDKQFQVQNTQWRVQGAYSAGGRQQPDSMGVRSAIMYSFRVWIK